MAEETTDKALPLIKVFKAAADYIEEFPARFSLFAAINWLFLLIGFDYMGGWSNPLFLVWTIFYYLFWCFFFRLHYGRKPYFSAGKIFDSLVPSTKILFITLVFVTLLAVIPYAPLFMGLPLEFTDKYTYFLKKYMQDSKIVDFGLSFILIFVSPLIFYRPFFAWISSVIGRSGLLRTAWNKTKGNYWRFVLIAVVFNAAFFAVEYAGAVLGAGLWLLLPAYAVLVVYFNLVIIKAYDFFFLDNLTE